MGICPTPWNQRYRANCRLRDNYNAARSVRHMTNPASDSAVTSTPIESYIPERAASRRTPNPRRTQTALHIPATAFAIRSRLLRMGLIGRVGCRINDAEVGRGVACVLAPAVAPRASHPGPMVCPANHRTCPASDICGDSHIPARRKQGADGGTYRPACCIC
jgi:hypothetical protein